MNIVARKPAHPNAADPHDRSIEYIVAERGPDSFVSATASPRSLAAGEWFWGHYFRTLSDALAHFEARKVV